jgi:FtsP/CotA-like multicopper oxidase with cupredoxin domain
MRKILRLTALSLGMIVVFGILMGPGQEAAVQAQGTVVYNLYATDGYLELPDGLPLYMYGFIGGREGADFTYTTSFAGVAPTNVAVPGGAVAPQGGPWVSQDAQFAGNAQFPAPIIYATMGDIVEIRLKNLGVAANPAAPNDPHSIHLHGLDVDAANDGVPETSLGAVPANLCLDGTTAANGVCDPKKTGGPAPGAGNVIVYMFTPTHPGTYMYHCHQEADIHVQMGMFGALVVYNPGDPAAATGPGQGLGGTLFGQSYDKDYVLLLSEFDVRGHQDEEGTYKAESWDPKPYNWALYRPQYWQINGISFPNTIHAGWLSGYTFAQWLEAHPGYDPLITGSVSGGNGAWGTPGEKVLLRVINMGFETHPMHMHGYHAKVLGSDQRGWDWSFRPFNEGLEKNTLSISSGETYEWLIDFGQQSFQSTYEPGTQSRYFDGTQACVDSLAGLGLPPPAALNSPVTNQATGCPVIPDFGDPAMAGVVDYIGGPTVSGLVGPTQPFDFAGLSTNQYFPFHNHDDYKATNNGVYPGGMFTMIVPTP